MTELSNDTLAPVVLEITVPVTAAEAFARWTEDILSWWPRTHSIGGDRVRDVVFEGRPGGSVHEVWDDGHTCPWARVLAWEPGRRLVLEWQPTAEPWKDEPRTEVEVVFTDVDGGALVRLEHRHWDRLDAGAALRANYDTGWRHIARLYAGAVEG